MMRMKVIWIISWISIATVVYSKDRVVAAYKTNSISLGEVQFGGEPSATNTFLSESVGAKKVEAQRIKAQLRAIILREAYADYSIPDPSKEEVDAALSRRLYDVYGTLEFTEEQARQQNQTIAEMIELIETWQKDPAAGEQLYNDSYKDRITEKYWGEIKSQYATPESLNSLKSRLPQVDANAVNLKFEQTVKKELKERKLREKLLNDGTIDGEKEYDDWIKCKMESADIDTEYRSCIFRTDSGEDGSDDKASSSMNNAPSPSLPEPTNRE